MFYAELKDKPEGPFKRLTGVRPATFLDMCEALEKYLPSGGRVPKLCREDRLLLTLMYWREYRTYAHIAQTYGLSESAVCRTVHMVEDALMRSGSFRLSFRLPGKKELLKKELLKKALTKSAAEYQVVVVDATECPVERPKKAAALLQRQEKASHPKGPSPRRPENQADPGDRLQHRQGA